MANASLRLPFHSGSRYQLSFCAESIQPSEGSSLSITAKSRRASSGCVSASPWVLKYSDLRLLKPIGEGAYSKVGRCWLLSGARVVSVCCNPCLPAVRGCPRCTSRLPPRVAGSAQPVHVCLQVYMATWRETVVAVKVFQLKDQEGDVGEEGKAAAITASNLLLDHLRKVC